MSDVLGGRAISVGPVVDDDVGVDQVRGFGRGQWAAGAPQTGRSALRCRCAQIVQQLRRFVVFVETAALIVARSFRTLQDRFLAIRTAASAIICSRGDNRQRFRVC